MLDTSCTLKGQTSNGADVEIHESDLGVLWQFAGWDGFGEALAGLLSPLGIKAADDMRTSTRGSGLSLWRIAPDKVLIAGNEPSASLAAIETGPDVVGLDLTHARIKIRIEGAGAPDLLTRLVPVDVSLASFPNGSFVQTGMHHVGVLIDRISDTCFEILVPRTWSCSLIDLMRVHLVT
tara:strand:- start:41455 stop:41991 length:537 start_codon:yes stop_codon:yes gene_type:complete